MALHERRIAPFNRFFLGDPSMAARSRSMNRCMMSPLDGTGFFVADVGWTDTGIARPLGPGQIRAIFLIQCWTDR